MRESVGAMKNFPKWKFFVRALGSNISCKATKKKRLDSDDPSIPSNSEVCRDSRVPSMPSLLDLPSAIQREVASGSVAQFKSHGFTMPDQK
jgi:hypothetical protein